jgi:hypothetical protein
MDLLVWIGVLVMMAAASYRAFLLWRNRTSAVDAWPAELQRSIPATTWAGTLFFGAGALIVLGDFGADHPITVVGAFVVVLAGVAAIGLGLSLMTRGRPQALVPPHLRHSATAGDADARPRRRRRRSANV